jgi:hypothetical protein
MTAVHYYIRASSIGYVARFDEELKVVVCHQDIAQALQFASARAAWKFIRYFVARDGFDCNGLDWTRVEIVGIRTETP